VRLGVAKSVVVAFELDFNAFAFWDIGYGNGDWTVEPGEFEIRIGSSSRDIRLKTIITFATGREASELAKTSYPPVSSLNQGGGTAPVDDEMFAKRFGRERFSVLERIRSRRLIDYEAASKACRFDRNSLLKEVAASSWIGRFLRYVVFSEAAKEIPSGSKENRQRKMMRENVDNLPLRALVLFSKGNLSFDTMDSMIAAMNGEYGTSIKFAARATGGIVVDTVSAVLCCCRTF